MSRHWVITGASAGIGEALAREAAGRGHRLTLVARREALLDELAASLTTECHVIAADLSDLSVADGLIARAEAALGPVDVLVNNAGVQVLGATAGVDPDEGERSLMVNLLSPLRLIRRALPGMLERGQGSIVNVASLAALVPTPGMTYYNAGKAGLAGASEALGGELKDTPIRVLTVYPGIIDETELGRRGLQAYEDSKGLAMQPRGTARELAERMVRAEEAAKARLIYPAAYHVTRWLPAVARWAVDAFSPPLVGKDASGNP